MRVYATSAQLAEWTGTASPGNAAQLLRSASLLVDRELLTAVYPTLDDGSPRDEGTAQVLADAVCAQAATWAALGIDPIKGAADEPQTNKVVRKTLATATIEYDRGSSQDRATYAAARQQAAVELAPDAQQILAAAGLLTGQVWLRG